jgi:hypothetical protein
LHAVLDSDELRTSTVSLAGHSLGGAIAIKLAELEGLHADAFNPAPLLAATQTSKAAAVVFARFASSFVPFARATYGFVRRHFLAHRDVSAWDVALPSSGRLGSIADEAYDYMSSKLTCAPFDAARGGSATVHTLLGDPVSGCYQRAALGFEVLRYPNLAEHSPWATTDLEGDTHRGAHINHLQISMFPPTRLPQPVAANGLDDLLLPAARTSQTVTLADAIAATTAYLAHKFSGHFGAVHQLTANGAYTFTNGAKTGGVKRAAWWLTRNVMMT